MRCLLGVLFGLFLGVRGQDQPPNISITPRKPAVRNERPSSNLRLDVNVVLIPVTVTDALGRPVTNLTKGRFRISEDGVEQKIISFSQEEAPVSLGLLFDSSGSMKNRIASSVESLRLLFRTTLPGDEFFVVQFADEPRLLGGFTTDPGEIQQRLGFIQAKGWTALLDALALSAHQMRSAVNQAKVLVVLSDGNDNNSRFTESEIRNIVVESDLRVYGIGLAHRPRFLQQIAEQTGGDVLVAQTLGELPDVIERLSREIRSQYLLGYSSTNTTNDGKYRRVKVELTRPPGSPQLRLSWRRGYYALAQ
jgi:Ca-activated chloride channel family protein